MIAPATYMGTPVMAAAAPVDEEADAWEADEAD